MSDDLQRLEEAIRRVERNLGRRIDELGKKVERVSEFQVGFRVMSRVMTFLLAVATAGAAVYGAFIR